MQSLLSREAHRTARRVPADELHAHPMPVGGVKTGRPAKLHTALLSASADVQMRSRLIFHPPLVTEEQENDLIAGR
ncbi:hypothetical protein EYF80_033370 [Liparis tanakae]|uniref:Uncharacterized protein n=1 Tax=Liparis tanakae TaxID=230148 RepID=A0A4Z2GSP2_9TELE|nr:hypothetical protein EYF80_033370 [Liparis tanakae]